MRNTSAWSKRVRSLTIAAMLAAMSVIIGIFCKNTLNFGEGLFRVTFENFPIIISGILFGPIVGSAVGITSDLISYLLSFQTYPPNLIVTLGAAMIGVISGCVSQFAIRKRGTLQIIVAGFCSHAIGSMLIKPIGLFSYYEWAVLFRIPLYLIIAPLEIFIMCMLFKNSIFKKMTDGIGINKELK